MSLILTGFSLLPVSCRHKPTAHRIVSVSILPQKYLVERIAGDYLEVNVMIPPGINPVTCDLNTEQLKKLYDSDLCFTIGCLPYELSHLYPVVGKLKHLKVIDHSGLLRLQEDSGSRHHDPAQGPGSDPHIWLSPALFRQMALTVYETLSERYPEQREKFKANHKRLDTDIRRIGKEARRTFTGRPRQAFLISHPALAYFAADYGIEQISIRDEGKEPSPAHLKAVIDLARQKGIRTIFVQRQFDSSNAEAIAKEIGAGIIPIDPLAEDWMKEMKHLIDSFK